MTGDEQAVSCAVEQAALDMPYIEVTDTAIFRKVVSAGDTSGDDRWYVDLTLQHHEDESVASALYRVWRTAEGLKAIKVKIA